MPIVEIRKIKMKFVYTITVLVITLLASYAPNQAGQAATPEQAVIPEIEDVRKLTLASKPVTDLRNLVRNQILSSAKNGKWSCFVNIQNFDDDVYNLIQKELFDAGYNVSLMPGNRDTLYPESQVRGQIELYISWRYNRLQNKQLFQKSDRKSWREKAM